jgi:hypothetical protein
MLWSLPLPLLLLLRRWLLLVPVLLLPPVLRCWCCHCHSSGMLLLLLVMLLLLLLLLLFGLFLLLALAALLAAAAAAADRRCIQLRQQCRHGRIRLLLPLLQLLLAAGPLLPRAPASPRSRVLLPLPHALPLLQAPQRLCCPRVSLLGGRLQLVDWLCIQAGRAGVACRNCTPPVGRAGRHAPAAVPLMVLHNKPCSTLQYPPPLGRPGSEGPRGKRRPHAGPALHGAQQRQAGRK